MPAILNPRNGQLSFVNNRVVGSKGRGIRQIPPPPASIPVNQPIAVKAAKPHRIAVMRSI